MSRRREGYLQRTRLPKTLLPMLGAWAVLSALFLFGCGGGGGDGQPPANQPRLGYSHNPARYAQEFPIEANIPQVTRSTQAAFSVVPALPAGLTLNPQTGVISGTPMYVTPLGSYEITMRDQGRVEREVVSLEVEAPILLFQEGVTAAMPVHYFGGDDERTAAEALASYLNKISGTTEFAASPGPGNVPSRAFLVGQVPYAGYELPSDLREDDFVVRWRSGTIQLTGKVSRSTAYAVYTYLERYLHCRFWGMNVLEYNKYGDWAEAVPYQNPLRSPKPHLVHRHKFDVRDCGCQESRHAPYRHRRLTTPKGSHAQAVSFTETHNMHTLMEGEKYGAYAATHPEIYPCGARGPGTVEERARNNLHLCYTDPGLPQALADALAVDVEDRGGNVENYIYFAGMGDWYGGRCQCDRCWAVYLEERWTDPSGVYSDKGWSATLIRLMNQVANILDARYPGIRVGTFAYMSLEAPPGITKPQPNVAIRMPRLRHCSVHGVDECAENAEFLARLKGWTSIDQGGGVYIWDYAQNFPRGFFYTMPNLYSIARNIKVYASLGVRGVYTQQVTNASGGDLVVLKNYVFSKLMIDPTRTVDSLVEEFCNGYYGPAAPHVLAYVRAVRDAVYNGAKPLHHLDEFATLEDHDSTWHTPAMSALLKQHRANAISAVADDPVLLQRAKEATVGVIAMEIFVEGVRGSGTGRGKVGELSEGTHDGKDVLIREEVGRYTYDEIEEVLKYVRFGTHHEGSNGVKYREEQRAAQGGPLVKLTEGDLLAKFAPAMRGQLRQLTYKGTDCLYVAGATDGFDMYPLAGSSHTFHSPQLTYMKIVGEPTTTFLEMVGDLGLTSHNLGKVPVDQIATQEASLADDGSGPSLSISGTSRLQPLGTPPTLTATVETVYAVDSDPTAHTVVTDAEAGTVTVTLPGQSWSILDEYRTVDVQSIDVTHNATLKTLTVRVTLAEVTTVETADTTYVDRRISIVEE